MWTSDIKPQVIEHGHFGRNNKYIYVVDIMLSSSIVERHIFFNGRKCQSFVGHLSRILPSYSRCRSGISYYHFYDLYSSVQYKLIKNFD